MNSGRWKVVLYGTFGLTVGVVAVAIARSGGGGGERKRTAVSRAPGITSARPLTGSGSGRTLTSTHPNELAPAWYAPVRRTAVTFVTWFDRWLAGEASASKAPDVTAEYAAKLRGTTNNVPPAAQGNAAVIVALTATGVPSGAAHPRKAWVHVTTRGQGATVQFTVEEHIENGRWLVFGVYGEP